jgi:hypothetical protein
MDDQRKGFLRTALTEERVGALEKQMARVIQKLGLEDEPDALDLSRAARGPDWKPYKPEASDDKTDVHVSGVRPPDGGYPDGRRVEPIPTVVREVRREADEPRVQASGNRRKRSR